MLDTYRVRDVRARNAVYGVAGHPVIGSLSPAMHNAWFEAADIDAVYLPLDTASADDLLEFAEWLPLAGLSRRLDLALRIRRTLLHALNAHRFRSIL
jgi:shikimate 5-dehydrogenase